MSLNPQNAQLADRNGRPLIGDAQAPVTNAVTNHTVNATFSNTEVKGHLDTLGTRLAEVQAILRAHGLARV